MSPLLICLLLFAIVDVSYPGIILTTCARMDTPILEKAARFACITSCQWQDCGTGYCRWRQGRPVCVCSRCH
ncbi:hypothetical protein ANCCAN_15620 [Ancylostoma caninum]|uniref:Uncharacterized protein n=1 Tax=Ancylostoma caninum TaxID=29170 RepID=A0A368G1Y7_ANCCA|nr:hypothetical protein ANCCAN_15620 [Ancylostoma caninum]